MSSSELEAEEIADTTPIFDEGSIEDDATESGTGVDEDVVVALVVLAADAVTLLFSDTVEALKAVEADGKVGELRHFNG